MKKSAITAAAVAMTLATPANAKAGDVLIRARAILVAPTEKTSHVLPMFPTGRVKVDNAVVPELDFTYMLTNHIGAELILATSKHDISGTGSLAPVGKLFSRWALPPTLTLQYHFAPDSHVRPYVGAGVNYTIFYNTKASAALKAALGPTRVKMADSFGYALQAGVDVDLTKTLFLNFDVKYIDLDTRATLISPNVPTVNRVKVHLDPIVAGVGLGIRL